MSRKEENKVLKLRNWQTIRKSHTHIQRPQQVSCRAHDSDWRDHHWWCHTPQRRECPDSVDDRPQQWQRSARWLCGRRSSASRTMCVNPQRSPSHWCTRLSCERKKRRKISKLFGVEAEVSFTYLSRRSTRVTQLTDLIWFCTDCTSLLQSGLILSSTFQP